MTIERLLIANRGEIAVRIARAAAELGIATTAVVASGDPCGHGRAADEVVPLSATGVGAYLDGDDLIAVAIAAGCDAVHPGYGFLSESAAFAQSVVDAGLTFVGPRPETLRILGDKLRARELARTVGVPVARGLALDETGDAAAFMNDLEPGRSVVVKASGGGGGRGIRLVSRPEELADAIERSRSEARRAFASDAVYLEEFISDARHIEVQVIGDEGGAIETIGTRDCSVQRQHQKIIEMAPAIGLVGHTVEGLDAAARDLASAAACSSLVTFEFLVFGAGAQQRFVFLEANPRLQVEHTVTEAVHGVDLVQAQLSIASGAALADVDLGYVAPHGIAIQARLNAETYVDGALRPGSGVVTELTIPTGPGLRVDTALRTGDVVDPSFDSLLAKVIAHHPATDPGLVTARARRALVDLDLVGPAHNQALLQAVLARDDLWSGAVSTTWFEDHLDELLAAAATLDAAMPSDLESLSEARADLVGALASPLPGTVLSFECDVGDHVAAGQPIVIMEAMKMEHVIAARHSGTVIGFRVSLGDAVPEGQLLVELAVDEEQTAMVAETDEVDLDRIRPDLAEVRQRHHIGLDESRPAAVEKRRRRNQRTARENLADLVDADSYIEYGPLVVAAQRRRRDIEDLVENTPADGMIAGIGRVNGDVFDESRARAVIMSYDYTVLAGTQGGNNHRKKDRLFDLAHKWQLPVVFFTEGGGGRPGDTDGTGVAGLDCLAFGLWAELSGLVPLIGINSGYCFAGNAAILGCCDVVIATENSNIGMGGPAMIEGGGLGVYKPTEIGPLESQRRNGVVDIVVADEAEAVAVAKQYLSYFQGRISDWECADQRLLRSLIPENRLRTYDVRRVIETLADTGSVLELRRDFGVGMITALTRFEGVPVGVIANNPAHLGGAIDSDAADKASRFMQLCDAFDLPILSLCDTPGIMVGPEVEKTALVRHASRMFVTGRSVTVPTGTIVLRKGYGLGAQAMASGGFSFPMFAVSWPTGEFGGMGLEGAVKLGYRRELEAIDDPDERVAAYEERVARMYAHGKAVSMADHFEIDDVIDPAASRHWITTAFGSAPAPTTRSGKKRPMIDTW